MLEDILEVKWFILFFIIVLSYFFIFIFMYNIYLWRENLRVFYERLVFY